MKVFKNLPRKELSPKTPPLEVGVYAVVILIGIIIIMMIVFN